MTDTDIKISEDRLKAAMLASDVNALDELLADDLVFTDHLGRVLSKQDDLTAHKSGFVKVRSIEQSQQLIKLRGDAAVVSVLSRIAGEFGGVFAETSLRFTRLWQKGDSGKWQVTAAHSTLVVEN